MPCSRGRCSRRNTQQLRTGSGPRSTQTFAMRFAPWVTRAIPERPWRQYGFNRLHLGVRSEQLLAKLRRRWPRWCAARPSQDAASRRQQQWRRRRQRQTRKAALPLWGVAL
eukprot:1419829-Prymnesium_polylepis.1